jgi:predicted RNA-binding protein YlxR (DUF448 family)
MPVRTCVVSRARLHPDQMVRLGIDADGRLCLRGPGPGRSAWVKPELVVLRKLEARPVLVRRSLRRVPSSTEGLVESVADFLAGRLAHRLRHAWRSGTVRAPDVCRDSPLAILKPWGEDRHREDEYVLPWDALGVGCLLGRPRIDRLVALPGRPSRALLHHLQIWRDLGYSPEPLAVSSSN